MDPKFRPPSGQAVLDHNSGTAAGDSTATAPTGSSPRGWEHSLVWMPHVWMLAIKMGAGVKADVITALETFW